MEERVICHDRRDGDRSVVEVLFGIIFAVVFAKARHRLPAATDHGRSVVLAALGFAVFVVLRP